MTNNWNRYSREFDYMQDHYRKSRVAKQIATFPPSRAPGYNPRHERGSDESGPDKQRWTMIGACKRFLERYPNVGILLIGCWFFVTPPAFGVHLRNLTAKNDALSGTDALLEQFVFNHKNQVAVVFAMMLIFGMGLIGFAIWRMVRRWIHKR